MNNKDAGGLDLTDKSDVGERRSFRDALRSSELRVATRGLLLALVNRGIRSWPSEQTLAVDAGMSERSVRNHLRRAEQAGWLVRERRPGRGGRFGHNCYQLTIPATFHQRQRVPVDQRQNVPPPAAKSAGHQRQNLPPNPTPEPNSEPENSEPYARARTPNVPVKPPREPIHRLACEGLGRGGAVSPDARRRVCAKLAIGDADPLVALYEAWPRSRTARDPDALFVSIAGKLYRDAEPEVRQACQPLGPPPVTIAALPPVRPSASLLASLSRGGASSRTPHQSVRARNKQRQQHDN